MDYRIIQGDIAETRADAIVNAAGTSLRMGSGVAGALRRRGGEALNDAAVEAGPVGLGEVAITDAFDLDADIVIHAAAMPHSGDGQATEASIRDATRNALEAADEHGCESVVLPVLGTGVAGMALVDGARIVCKTVAGYEPTTLTDVAIIAYDDDAYETLKTVCDATG